MICHIKDQISAFSEMTDYRMFYAIAQVFGGLMIDTDNKRIVYLR